MARPLFIFGGDTGVSSPKELKRLRAIAEALSGPSQAPRNVGEGLNAIGQALVYRSTMGKAGRIEEQGKASAAKTMAPIYEALTGRSSRSPFAPSAGEALAGKSAPVSDFSQTATSPSSAENRIQSRIDQAHGGPSSPFMTSLIGTESGGNWQAQNNEVGAGGARGHFGRLQFGQARLQDAKNAGVIPQNTTPEQFKASPQMQKAVENWHFADIDQEAAERGLTSYVGESVGGVQVTPNAIRAMAHLGGIGGAEKFLESGGVYNPSDAYGTSLSDYGSKHGSVGTQVASLGPATPASALQPPSPASAPIAQAAPAGQIQMAQAQPAALSLPSLYQALEDPWLDDGQRSLILSEIERQQQAADPITQMRLQQAQIELQDAQRGQWARLDDGRLYNQRTGEIRVLPGDPNAGPSNLGLVPQYGVNANGDPVLLQMSKDGRVVQSELPEGVSLAKEPIKLDAGTHFVLLDPITRQPIGEIPKENRAEARETAIGTAEGKARGETAASLPSDLLTAEQTIREVDALMNHEGLSSVFGPMDQFRPSWSMSAEGRDALARYKQISGRVFLQGFALLKGGGQITEVEGLKAEQASARLDRAQSEEEAKAALKDFRDAVEAGMRKLRERAGLPATSAQVPPAAPSAPVTIDGYQIEEVR